jgi:MFS family permease
MAFSAMLLGSVVFLQTVWHYSVLRAGLAVTPGPLLAGLTGALVGRVADRFGHRTFVVAGAVLYATGQILLLTRVQPQAHYVSVWLPAIAITGIGVGCVLPTLSSAAVRSLPPGRFGVGSAINTTSRQFGTVLGVAAFIAILGTPVPATVMTSFRHVWMFTTSCAVLSGLVATGLGRAAFRAPAAPMPLAPLAAS